MCEINILESNVKNEIKNLTSDISCVENKFISKMI